MRFKPSPATAVFVVAGLLVSAALFALLSGVLPYRREPSAGSERNRIALENAVRGIERNRKADVALTVRGAGPDAVVRVHQLSHDFKFGCYLKLDDIDPRDRANYEKRFRDVFNYAVVGTYWDFTEPRRGESDWRWFEEETATAGRLGARIQVAPLLWGTKSYGTPKWLPRDRDGLRPIVERRVAEAMRRSAAAEEVEVVNEPLAPSSDFFADSLGSDYIAEAFREARRSDPAKRLMINEFGVIGEEAGNSRNAERYFRLLEKLAAAGVPIDVIGIQAHSNGEWFEPADVADALARYGALGKPIQISEFSAQTRRYEDPSRPLAIGGGYFRGKWNDELQAQFFREFYTVAFGDPNVEAIVTWGLDDKRAWLPGIGLLDSDGTPKPAYETLNRLINVEWRTNLELKPDGDGRAAFRGFSGQYEVTIESKGKVVKKILNISKNSGNEWLIEL